MSILTGASDEKPMALGLSVRSYGADHGEHRHDFGQLVLPLSGFLEIDVNGRQAPLMPGRAAFVGVGERHSQEGRQPNMSLILDLDLSSASPQANDALAAGSFLTLNPLAGKLVDYMGLMTASGAAPSAQALSHWTPLLLDALTTGSPSATSRLDGLLARMEAEPGVDWTVERMAERVGISASRLHVLFREGLQTTPAAALADIRLKQAARWLTQTELPISELAYRAGYSDQSALTRAMRRSMDVTPAAYRRLSRLTTG